MIISIYDYIENKQNCQDILSVVIKIMLFLSKNNAKNVKMEKFFFQALDFTVRNDYNYNDRLRDRIAKI
jgi:hypothetical protein